MLLTMLAGCSESVETIDGRARAEFDEQVDTIWKSKWTFVEANQFFDKGGEYIDSGEKGDPAYDKPLVVPLLKKLSAKHGIKWFAVVGKKKRNFAFAIVGEFPRTEKAREKVMETLNEEQKTFKLDILVQEGNRWLSLDFLNPDESKFLSDAPPKKD